MKGKRALLRLGMIMVAFILALVALLPQQARADSNNPGAAAYRFPAEADAGIFATLGTITPTPNHPFPLSHGIDPRVSLNIADFVRVQNFRAFFADTLMEGNLAHPCAAVYRGGCVIAPALTIVFDTPDASRPLVMLTVGEPHYQGSPGPLATVTAGNQIFFYLPKEDAPTTHHTLVLYPRAAPDSYNLGTVACGSGDPEVPFRPAHCTLTPNQALLNQTWASIWDDTPSDPTRAPAASKLF